MSVVAKYITKTPLLSISAFANSNTFNKYAENFNEYDKHIINPSGKNHLIVNKDLQIVLQNGNSFDNNETIGQSAEKALCQIFNIQDYIDETRVNTTIVNKIISEWNTNNIMNKLKFKVIESIGYKNGAVDFSILENNNLKTLSVKTLKSRSGKICPQTIGQPTYKKWDEYFNQDHTNSDKDRFMYIKNNIKSVLDHYLNHTFCCDYLMLISNCYDKPNINLINKPNITFSEIDYNIIFTRNYDNSNIGRSFSTTLKLETDTNVISIGEFQFHRKKENGSGRNNLKFRFFNTFLSTMNSLKSQ